MLRVSAPIQTRVDVRPWLYRELTGFLRQHYPVRDPHHVVLSCMVARQLLSDAACFHSVKTRLCSAYFLVAGCQRWLAYSL